MPMTLRQLAERAAQMVQESDAAEDGRADLPVVVRLRKFNNRQADSFFSLQWLARNAQCVAGRNYIELTSDEAGRIRHG